MRWLAVYWIVGYKLDIFLTVYVHINKRYPTLPYLKAKPFLPFLTVWIRKFKTQLKFPLFLCWTYGKSYRGLYNECRKNTNVIGRDKATRRGCRARGCNIERHMFCCCVTWLDSNRELVNIGWTVFLESSTNGFQRAIRSSSSKTLN